MTEPPEGSSRILSVAVIGAGFGGLCAGIKLRKSGIEDFTIFERASGVGGVWRDNTYPGAAVDVSTLQYSLSFEPNPGWRNLYATQADLLDYLRGIVEKYELEQHLRLDTEIVELRFDEDASLWMIRTGTGDEIRAHMIINATGLLSKPQLPRVEGLTDFQGTVFHSAAWNHDHDLTGERVAVVGTGASSAQFVPKIAGRTEQLHIFQRSAPWVYPRGDRETTPTERLVYGRVPGVLKARRLYRWASNDAEQRGLEKKTALIVESRAAGEKFIAATIDDHALRAIVTPDYDPGCKRRIVSDEWYPTLNRPDVEVIPAGVARLTADSVIGTDGTERAVDTVIFGTGFAASDFLAPMKVWGRGDVELSDYWQRGARSNLGITISGFPNLFLVLGPNSGLGNNSQVFMIECQVRYAVAAIRHARSKRFATIEVREDVATRSYEELQERLAASVFGSGCAGWYHSADGRIDTLWPGTTAEYWLRTRFYKPSQYLETKSEDLPAYTTQTFER